MEYSLTLPTQLRSNQPFRRSFDRSHIDLNLALTGQGRAWAHLTEIGLRMRMPATLFVSKTKVEYPTTKDGWNEVGDHVRFDTVLTAMVAVAWLHPRPREPQCADDDRSSGELVYL